MTSGEFEYLTSLGYDGSLADKRNAYYDDLILNGGDSNRLLVGESTFSRELLSTTGLTFTSGQLSLVYFTAKKSETVTHITSYTNAGAAAATPSLCRRGIYEEDEDGNLTLIASHANSTSLFASAYTAYKTALTASFTKQAGSRYAVANLIVSATTMPSFLGTVAGAAAAPAYAVMGLAPRLAGRLDAQADLPASIAVGDILNAATQRYFYLLEPA